MSNEEKKTVEKTPEKLGIKVGSKEQAAWTAIKEQAQRGIDESQRLIEINKRIVLLATEKIAQEERKQKV